MQHLRAILRRLGRTALVPWSAVVVVLASIGAAVATADGPQERLFAGLPGERITAIVPLVPPIIGPPTGPTGSTAELPLASRGRVAILLTGLGLNPKLDASAARLPAAVGIAWSAYGDNPLPGLARMRRLGHEVWLELPISKGDPSRFQAGPLALSPSRSDDRNLQRLRFVLARAVEPAGVVADPGAFAASPTRLNPVVARLAQAGLPLLLYGASAHGVIASDIRPAWRADTAVGVGGRALDETLAEVVGAARRRGKAITVVGGTIAAIDRVRRWQQRLDREGLTLVAPSRLLSGRDDPATHAQGVAFRTRAASPGQGEHEVEFRAEGHGGSVERAK